MIQTLGGKYSIERVKSILEYIITKCDKILIDAGDDNKVGVTARNSIIGAVTDMKYALDLINSGGKWDDIKKIIDNLKINGFGNFKAAEKDDLYYEISGRTKALTKDFASLASIMTCYSEDFKKDIQYLRPIILAFKNCVIKFSQRLEEAKIEKNAYDYPDILHMALKLLVTENPDGSYGKTQLATEMSEKYDEILIDEFQDTNEAQDTLFNAISKNGSNLFMVGDVKQSIYRFRHRFYNLYHPFYES